MGFDINRSMAIRAGALETAKQEEIAEEQVDLKLQACADEGVQGNPMAVANQSKRLQERAASSREGKGKAEEEEKAEGKETKAVKEITSVEDAASKFQERENPELNPTVLKNLHEWLLEECRNDTPAMLLSKVLNTYHQDYYLANSALDFLIQSFEKKAPDLADKLREVKGQLNLSHGPEIRAGHNIALQSREFAKEGAGTTTTLRSLYDQTVTQHQFESAPKMFEAFTSAFPFNQLRKVLAFMLHAIGDDFKSKGPSIEKGELANLFKEVKAMQAILQVFRFFKGRSKGISTSFERLGLTMPNKINFETLSKAFVKLIQDPYPSAEGIYKMGASLGVQDSLDGEGIIFLHMRDAIRNVDPKLFKSEQHRQQILELLQNVLKEIDDKIDTEVGQESSYASMEVEAPSKEIWDKEEPYEHVPDLEAPAVPKPVGLTEPPPKRSRTS